MLKPQSNSTRELVSLDGIWNFAIADSIDIETDAPWAKPIPSTLQVPVPASYNDIFVDEKIRSHVGWVYYQRQVTVPRGWSEQRYFLRFDAATHRGRVYVNDQLVADHSGGYTPFEADITASVKPGQKFRLTVAVSNELTWDTIPPGRIETLQSGKRKQHYQHDFFNYAGLARSVSLYAVPSISVSDITVVTDVGDGNTGIVNFEVETTQSVEDNKLKVSIIDEEGDVVASVNGSKGQIKITSANLWKPGAAYLYQLRADILQGSESTCSDILDTYELNFGIRTIKVEGNRFLINNEPFYFTGFGKHEDSPIRGKGFDAAYMIHDFNLMSWIGANSFRTSHYPYAEEVLDYADRHGIVVINETAAVGLNLAIVAGMFGLKPPPTFCPEACGDNTQAAHLQGVRELVARDKNHPSVVMWTVTNEPASNEPGVREYLEPVVSLTRKLDPTRPVCFANMGFATFETDLVTDLFDVICLNRYQGWYTQTGDLESAEKALEDDLMGWHNKYGKPIIMTEYGAEALAGLHSVADLPWSEEYQAKFLEMFHRVFDRVDSVVGEHVWNFADFQTTSGIHRVDGNKKGIFTRDRRPKSSARVLKDRWAKLQGKKP
ncbi:hypothetical protein CkaCkLH20_05341 [Colletotrichum karsti]|uniref:Beta-glucuronidase n=1 Tax=Colletotrichum karsti TaxID=1095194 RepID=A0A9P6IE85_9PEZI|nr:uncharacterized protein CkaCkLH20_05341 [Colletotrichum karsti]KAF9877075.1 hypothetical protein CkaCkLH20_05341 [Colletotrichum karsti]